MARFYYLGPWVLDTKGPFPVHRAPTGSIGCVDLRALDGNGVGFFTTDAPLSDSDYTAFGNAKGDRLDALGMDDGQRTAFAGLVGLDDVPASATLLDLLWDSLTILSDPDGAIRAKPIMPTRAGALELHLGGHSLVRTAKMPKDPTQAPHWDKIQRVIQNDFRAVKALADQGATQKERDLAARWLGDKAIVLGLDYAATKALLIPGDMEPIDPKPPETTINESFNKADSGTLGPDLSWTEIEGGIDVVSNRAQAKNGGFNTARADSDLSSADHYSKATTQGTANGYPGTAVRVDSSGALTYYVGRILIQGAGQALYKLVTGSYSALGSSHAAVTANTDYLVKTTANGSTISFDRDSGADTESLTDTSISSGVRCGISGYEDVGDAMQWDAFEASDLGGGGGFSTAQFRENAGLGAAGSGPFARANAGLGAVS